MRITFKQNPWSQTLPVAQKYDHSEFENESYGLSLLLFSSYQIFRQMISRSPVVDIAEHTILTLKIKRHLIHAVKDTFSCKIFNMLWYTDDDYQIKLILFSTTIRAFVFTFAT